MESRGDIIAWLSGLSFMSSECLGTLMPTLSPPLRGSASAKTSACRDSSWVVEGREAILELLRDEG
jgi:hypothetical protein